jgi:hypothetical protein
MITGSQRFTDVSVSWSSKSHTVVDYVIKCNHTKAVETGTANMADWMLTLSILATRDAKLPIRSNLIIDGCYRVKHALYTSSLDQALRLKALHSDAPEELAFIPFTRL